MDGAKDDDGGDIIFTPATLKTMTSVREAAGVQPGAHGRRQTR
jgi:hypothetical protein